MEVYSNLELPMDIFYKHICCPIVELENEDFYLMIT